MVSYQRMFTTVFIFTLIFCQAGVCTAAPLFTATPDATLQSQGCHDMAEVSDHNDAKDVLSIAHHGGSDCCHTGSLNSKDLNPDIIQLTVLITFTTFDQGPTLSSNPLNYLHNKGHPPGVPVFIQKSSLII